MSIHVRYGDAIANYDPFGGSRCFDLYDYDDSDSSDIPGFHIRYVYEGVSLPRRKGPEPANPETHKYDIELPPSDPQRTHDVLQRAC